MVCISGAMVLGWSSLAAAQDPAAARGDKPAQGATSQVQVWPTVTPGAGVGGRLRQPTNTDGPLAERASEIDALVADAAQDLGLLVDVGSRGPRFPRVLRDLEVIEAARAAGGWVISPRVERDGAGLLVRIVAAAPGSPVVLVREERTTADDLAVRVVVMVRDVVNARRGASDGAPKAASSGEQAVAPSRERARSPGRAALSFSMAAFGGYIGYALQKSSRGDDPRLLYPLMAVGTGVGLGAATIVADEWDVGAGEAWFLAAGGAWPVAATLLATTGADVQPTGDRHAFALLAGLGGMGLASAALSRRSVSEGSALLTHSGAAVGAFVGGAIELLAREPSEAAPLRGLGYGAGAGLLIAGVTATRVDASVSRVLGADLGVGIGALAGAAVGSPLLLRDATEGRQRGWLAITLGGSVIGGVAGAWLSGPATKGGSAASGGAAVAGGFGVQAGLPTPGVVAVTQRRDGGLAAAGGVTWGGQFW